MFSNLSKDCKPIATKSRRYSNSDYKFIEEEVANWLNGGICHPSNSPWRAQVVVVTDPETGKQRLCIDYSQTINLFTELDAYPIPRIEDLVHKLAGYKLYATYDLKSAYHQIPIRKEDVKYTAFEAAGKLYEMDRLPFGVKNGGPCFQRVVDGIIEEDDLKDTYAYFDNVFIGADDDEGLKRASSLFLKSMHARNMTLNHSKTVYGVTILPILGYCVGNNEIRPDPDRSKALQELPPPQNFKSLQRCLGFFAYYAKWVVNFSDRINKLKSVKKFPLTNVEVDDFNGIKNAIASSTLKAIDEDQPFTVECDASDVAVSATLNQNGRPVAFMSRTLQGSELHYPAMEKEATSIIEAVRKWSHFLIRKPFTIITDQRSVAFMFDARKRTKIKNNKVLCWRLELASFTYTIVYRPGVNNAAPDALSRAFCATINTPSLMEIHKNLGCPGITRLVHFVRAKNLPYSVDDCKKVCKICPSCAEVKPKFYSPPEGTLIKATKPMERLNLDFKGPLSSKTRNKFILCIVDEFSRFPFCFACPDVSSKTVVNCLGSLFTLFGTCSYVHSDRATSFRSEELRAFLLERGVACSFTTPYHPKGNGQVERYNQTVWRTIRSLQKSRGLAVNQWECVLGDALHSIRSLLCTATGQTPHERFFEFSRRSSHGKSLPDWLINPGPVYLRKFERSSKSDDLVMKVELIECNPMYAHIRYPDGRESNVSVRDLAPYHESDSNSKGLVETCNNGSDFEDLLDFDVEDNTQPVVEKRTDFDRPNRSLADVFAEDDANEDFKGFPSDANIDSNQIPTSEFHSSHLSGSTVGQDPCTTSSGNEPMRSSRSSKGVPPNRYSASSL